MGNLSLFLKKNKKIKANTFYPATKSLCDEEGKPLEWEIRALTTKESENIRSACTKEIPVDGKKGLYRPRVDTKLYVAKIMVASVVFPDLYNSELQDSYGVTKPEDLIKEMIDNPAEYDAFAEFVTNYNGLDESFADKVEEAKN